MLESYGTFYKKDYQITISKQFKIIFYNKETYFGCQIYQEKQMICVIEFDKLHKNVSYAYKTKFNKVIFNDFHYVSFLDLEYFDLDLSLLKKVECFYNLNNINNDNIGIYFENEKEFNFEFLSLNYHYVFQINNDKIIVLASKIKIENDNIYSLKPFVKININEDSFCNIIDSSNDDYVLDKLKFVNFKKIEKIY